MESTNGRRSPVLGMRREDNTSAIFRQVFPAISGAHDVEVSTPTLPIGPPPASLLEYADQRLSTGVPEASASTPPGVNPRRTYESGARASGRTFGNSAATKSPNSQRLIGEFERTLKSEEERIMMARRKIDDISGSTTSSQLLWNAFEDTWKTAEAREEFLVSSNTLVRSPAECTTQSYKQPPTGSHLSPGMERAAQSEVRAQRHLETLVEAHVHDVGQRAQVLRIFEQLGYATRARRRAEMELKSHEALGVIEQAAREQAKARRTEEVRTLAEEIVRVPQQHANEMADHSEREEIQR